MNMRMLIELLTTSDEGSQDTNFDSYLYANCYYFLAQMKIRNRALKAASYCLKRSKKMRHSENNVLLIEIE